MTTEYPKFPDIPTQVAGEETYRDTFWWYALTRGWAAVLIIAGLGWFQQFLDREHKESQAGRVRVEQAIHNYCEGKPVKVLDSLTKLNQAADGEPVRYAIVESTSVLHVRCDDYLEIGAYYYLVPAHRLEGGERRWVIAIGPKMRSVHDHD